MTTAVNDADVDTRTDTDAAPADAAAAPVEQTDTAGAQQQAQTGQAAPPKKFLGKYDSIEALERAHAELESKLGDMGREKGDLQRQMETLREQARQAQQLAELEARTRKPDARQEQFDAFVKQYAEKYGTSEEAARELLGVSASWVSDEGRRLREELKAEREEWRKEIATLRDAQEQLAPDYAANKAEVDRIMRDYGIPRKAAIAWAAEKRQLAGAADARVQPSLGSPAGRTTQQPPKEKPDISDEDWAKFKAEFPELTDEMRATIERERREARKRQAQKVRL